MVNLELSGRPYPGATLIFSVFIQLNCAGGCPPAAPRRDRTALPERPAPEQRQRRAGRPKTSASAFAGLRKAHVIRSAGKGAGCPITAKPYAASSILKCIHLSRDEIKEAATSIQRQHGSSNSINTALHSHSPRRRAARASQHHAARRQLTNECIPILSSICAPPKPRHTSSHPSTRQQEPSVSHGESRSPRAEGTHDHLHVPLASSKGSPPAALPLLVWPAQLGAFFSSNFLF